MAAGRRVSADAVRAGFGQGFTLTAADALAAGLVDRVDTFAATLARLGAATAPTSTVVLPAAARAQQRAHARELLASLDSLTFS